MILWFFGLREFGDDFVKFDVVRFPEMEVGEAGGVTEADGVNFGMLAEETVVEAAAVAKAVAGVVEGEAGDESDGILENSDFRGILGLGDAK